jgi:hypothetical protein
MTTFFAIRPMVTFSVDDADMELLGDGRSFMDDILQPRTPKQWEQKRERAAADAKRQSELPADHYSKHNKQKVVELDDAEIAARVAKHVSKHEALSRSDAVVKFVDHYNDSLEDYVESEMRKEMREKKEKEAKGDATMAAKSGDEDDADTTIVLNSGRGINAYDLRVSMLSEGSSRSDVDSDGGESNYGNAGLIKETDLMREIVQMLTDGEGVGRDGYIKQVLTLPSGDDVGDSGEQVANALFHVDSNGRSAFSVDEAAAATKRLRSMKWLSAVKKRIPTTRFKITQASKSSAGVNHNFCNEQVYGNLNLLMVTGVVRLQGDVNVADGSGAQAAVSSSGADSSMSSHAT